MLQGAQAGLTGPLVEGTASGGYANEEFRLRVFIVMVSDEPQAAYVVEAEARKAASSHPPGETKVRTVELYGLDPSDHKDLFSGGFGLFSGRGRG